MNVFPLLISPPWLRLLSVLRWWFCCNSFFIVYCCSHCWWGSVFGHGFCYAVLSVLPSFVIILIEKRERVALLRLSS